MARNWAKWFVDSIAAIPIEPYFRDETTALYHGTCETILPNVLPFKLLLTDPPFGINVLATGGNVASKGSKNTIGGRNYVKRGSKGTAKVGGKDAAAKVWDYSEWDDKTPDQSVIDLCISKSEQAIIWGGNFFALPPQRGWLVWDKRNEGTSFADCELAWTNLNIAVRKFAWRWNGMLQERSGSNKDVRVHPTQKPLSLMRFCLSLAPFAKSVVDPFAGSGTTLLAAKLEGRYSIGFEADLTYCERAANRLRQKTFEFDDG